MANMQKQSRAAQITANRYDRAIAAAAYDGQQWAFGQAIAHIRELLDTPPAKEAEK